MSNTFLPGEIAKTLSRVGARVLQPALAPFPKFTTVLEIENDPVALDSVVALASAPTATRSYARGDVPDFSTSGCALSPVSFAHRLYVQAFEISNSDLQSGGRLEWLGTINAIALAQTLTDTICALLTPGNFGAPVVTASATNFGQSDFDSLLSGISSPSRAAVLDTSYFCKVKPTWLPVGFNSVFEMSRWNSAASNVHGIIADPKAILLRVGIPMLMPRGAEVVARELTELPAVGLICETAVWTTLATRSISASFSLYFAASVGDPAALKLLSSG